MIQKIVKVPADILRKIVKPVTVPEPSMLTSMTIWDLMDTLRDSDGIGLSAPQINVDLAICIVGREMPLILMNPVITKKSNHVTTEMEGCLSIPNVYLPITRPYAVTINCANEFMEDMFIDLYGPMARIAQHEIDHLRGVLIIDYEKH